MRWLWLLLVFPLLAFRPIFESYDTPENIKDEFGNVEESVQDQQFTVYKTTPNVSELKEGQIVIFSSGAVKLMLRNMDDIYAVQLSCITVNR